MRTEINNRRRPRCMNRLDLVREFVSGKSVLDVGVIDHAMEYIDQDDWLHSKIKGWARELVGVDVLEEECARLRERGFDVRAVDATSGVDMGKRFERIVLGEVIEHVNDPVKLLEFSARHLTPGGLILATTPNPWFCAHLYESVRLGLDVGNVDHVMWIAPVNALELARRAGLEFYEYRLIQSPAQSGGWKLRLLYRLRDLMMPEQELFGHSYAYVFRKPA